MPLVAATIVAASALAWFVSAGDHAGSDSRANPAEPDFTGTYGSDTKLRATRLKADRPGREAKTDSSAAVARAQRLSPQPVRDASIRLSTKPVANPHPMPIVGVPENVRYALEASDPSQVDAPMPIRQFSIPPRHFPMLIGHSNKPGDISPKPIELELGPGTIEPIALAEPLETMTPAQATAVAEISDDFIDRIEEAATTLPDEALSGVWDAEQENADSLYRVLFGDVAYNEKLMERALDALGLPSAE